MKIEKVNENQIRCTLTREDLLRRQLKISELAYGTEKAKNLFQDMMRQANFEFGFEAEDIPLMIEAVPLNAECIVLIITKVEDPEELDTRFARFSPSVNYEVEEDMATSSEIADMDDIEDLYNRITQGSAFAEAKHVPEADKKETTESSGRTRLFWFATLGNVIDAAGLVAASYNGQSTLYKSPKGKYLLALTQGADSESNFDRVCNSLSEYGLSQRMPSGRKNFLQEHAKTLIAENAIQSLGKRK